MLTWGMGGLAGAASKTASVAPAPCPGLLLPAVRIAGLRAEYCKNHGPPLGPWAAHAHMHRQTDRQTDRQTHTHSLSLSHTHAGARTGGALSHTHTHTHTHKHTGARTRGALAAI